MSNQIDTTEMPTPSIMLEQLLDGRYRIVQILESNRLGQVCIGIDTTQAHEPDCLIKCFKPASYDRISLEIARNVFLTEAQKLKRLSEQTNRVPQIWDYFEQENEFYLVEEIIQGRSLHEELAGQTFRSELDVVELLLEVLETLRLVHHLQIIHGDINPHNLIRRSLDRKLVLVNFAVIKSITAPLLPDSTGVFAIGTPSYMPAEQAQGELHSNCDIYALGLTAIQVLTGQHPSQISYNGKTETFNWQSQIKISTEFEIILNQMIKPDRHRRYQDVEEVIVELRPFVEPIAPTTILYTNLDRPKRNWWLWLGIVGLVLGLLGATYFGIRRYAPNLSLLQPSLFPNWLIPEKSGTQLVHISLKLKSTLTGHKGWVRSVAFLPNGNSFASGSHDQTILLWNLERSTPFASFSNHAGFITAVNAIATTNNSSVIASGNLDKTVRFWDYRSNLPKQVLTGHGDQIFSLVFTPKGEYLVTASADRTLKIWDWQKNKLIKTLSGHKDQVLTVAISPDGKAIASGSRDKTIKLWNSATGENLKTLIGHSDQIRSLAFSPNGKILASSSQDSTIKLWNAETGVEIATLKGHEKAVTAIAFSADGQTLASGSFDTTVKLWDLNTYKEIQTLRGHTGPVLSVAFSPKASKSNTLISGSVDRTIKVWQ